MPVCAPTTTVFIWLWCNFVQWFTPRKVRLSFSGVNIQWPIPLFCHNFYCTAVMHFQCEGSNTTVRRPKDLQWWLIARTSWLVSVSMSQSVCAGPGCVCAASIEWCRWLHWLASRPETWYSSRLPPNVSRPNEKLHHCQRTLLCISEGLTHDYLIL